jgi:hypothetical protein
LRAESDRWILTSWEAARNAALTGEGLLLTRGVANPALLKLLPALLAPAADGPPIAWLVEQVEALLRHLEIRKQDALANWQVEFAAKLRPAVLLTIAQQLARLSCAADDPRYLNTALKILDWTSDCANSSVDWKRSLYRHASQECELAIGEWAQRC